ncbi:MAG: YdeI/OmpD-associated family protein [Saprospiraceae bacterium]|nr:YdeI/OmpD-associated family protein [Saprospiraceae bacterium]
MADDEKIFYPKSPKHWREWLEKNHIEKNSVWLLFYKKKSGKPSLTWSESVDEALCFGWIDSVKKSLDEDSYKQYFCKRKPKSNWSEINKQKVVDLTKKGLMSEAGLVCVQKAKQNGSWDKKEFYDDKTIPDDLLIELQKVPGAETFFSGLSYSVKKNMLVWIATAKKTETRQKRIIEIANLAGQNLKPKQF